MPFPFIPVALAGISALGGLLNNRGSTATQNSSGTSNAHNLYSNQNLSRNYQNLGAADQSFLDTIRNKYMGLLSNDPDLSGYAASNIGNINKNFDIAGRNAQEMLAARGVTGGPALATSLINNDANRIAQITNFQQNLPLLQRQLTEDTLGKAIGAFSQFPKDLYSEAYTSGDTFNDQYTQGTGAAYQPGNMLGGLTGNLGSILAFLYGQGAFNKTNSAPKIPDYGDEV